MSTRRAEPVEAAPLAEPPVTLDPNISASAVLSDAVSARDAFLQQEPEGHHVEVLNSISQCAEDLVASAIAKLCRCSESAVTATSLPYPPCPSPSASRLAATAPDGQRPAPLPVVRQALERALLQNSDDFWKELPRVKREDMSKQCPKRRGVQAMQLFLRLHILVACKDDIPLQRLVTPPIIIPYGPFWDEIEGWWGDLVNEVGEIPFGGNEYFVDHIKPSLSSKIPQAIQMLGRNCGIYTEDDLLLDPEGDGGAVVGDSCCPAPSGSRALPSRASSIQPSGSRGSGGLARPAVSDTSSGHGSGSTLPQAKPDAAVAAKPKTGSLPARPPPRKRDLTQKLGNGRQIKWNPKAAALPQGRAAMAGGRPGRKGQPRKYMTPPPKPIRASDLAVSPSSTEDSDAIPGTERKGQQEVTSAQPKASKRHLTFCPIPTIQELEAQEARDADADSIFEEADAPAAEAAPEEAPLPVAKGWCQNATRKAPLGRYGSRKMSRGASSVLPPAPSLHAAPSTRLSQLQGALSPNTLPAPQCISPQRPHGRASPRASPGLKSPSRFSPVLSRMSPHSARHVDVGSPVFSPGKPKAAQHSLVSLGRHRPAQRALLNPENSHAMHDLLPDPHHGRPQSNQQAGAFGQCQAVSGNGEPNNRDGAHLNAVAKGPRPGSATFSSTVPPQAERQEGFCQAAPTPLPSPFAAVVPTLLGAPDNVVGPRQGGSAADPAARPQSASFSSQMLQQGAMDAPVSSLPLQMHTSSPTQELPSAYAASPEAGTSEDRLDDTIAASPEPAPLAKAAWVAAAGAVCAAASAALARDGLPGGASADKALQGRPASAFAPVADLPAPMDWQASAQMEPAMAEDLTCAELTGADAQLKATGSVTAQPSGADMEVVEHRTRRKLTKRKKTDPCMESQPLACAKQADADTQAQCMAPDGVTVNANASTSYCTEATDGGHGVQAGPEPSSPAVAHQLAEIQHTAADDSTQLHESPVLHSDRAEGQCVASGAWPNRGFGSEAVCVDDVGEVADTQEGSLAAVQPNDDETEVHMSDPQCSSPVVPEEPAPVPAMSGEHSPVPAQQPLALQPDRAESPTLGNETAAQQQVDALPPEGTTAPESTAAAYTSTGTSAVDQQAEGAPQQCQEAGSPRQRAARRPTQQADSMADTPAVFEADACMHDNDTATKAALVPAEVADTEGDDTPEIPDIEHEAADAQNAVPAPLPTNCSLRKPGRQRKSRKPTAGALGAALAEGKSAGRPETRSLAKTLRSGKTVMPPSVDPSTANAAPGCKRPHQGRSRRGAKLKETEGAGASTEAQPEAVQMPSDATADPAAGSVATATTQKELGCPRCRYAIKGCSSCRPKLAGSKQAAGRAGCNRAPSANAAPGNVGGGQPTSSQVVHSGKQLHMKQVPAEAAEPNSRAARAANRAVKEPMIKDGSDADSDAEQLAIKPMPRSLQHRKLQSSSQHEAHERKKSIVKAVAGPNPHEAVTMDLPADRPSSSATATRDSSASPQPTQQPLEAPVSLRRSTRHQQSAQPAVQGVSPEDVYNAGAQAATAAAAAAITAAVAPTSAATAAAAAATAAATAVAAAPTAAAGMAAAATPAAAEHVAPETVRHSGRARKPALLQYEQLTKARGSRSPPEDAPKDQPPQPPQSKARRIRSAPSKTGKRAACEPPVINDSEDETPSASTATAAAAVPEGQSTASKKKKVCRRQAAAPALPPIQEEDEAQQLDPGPEFVHHRVHTHFDTAQHLGGLSPAEKPKRRRKAPASVRSGSPAKSRLAVSAEHSQLQTESSNPMDVLLAAAEYTEAQAKQDSAPKAAPSKGTKRKKAATSGRRLRSRMT